MRGTIGLLQVDQGVAVEQGAAEGGLAVLGEKLRGGGLFGGRGRALQGEGFTSAGLVAGWMTALCPSTSKVSAAKSEVTSNRRAKAGRRRLRMSWLT